MFNNIIDSYSIFINEIKPYTNIQTEEDYIKTLALLEQILETADDTKNSHFNYLIDFFSNSIAEYENKDQELRLFLNEIDNLSNDSVVVKTLIDQYNLKGHELPEIGDKTMVSKILNNKRKLTRQAIDNLIKRFNLPASLFF